MIVKYSKKFNTGPWLNEDIGFEIELEDTEGKPLPEAIQVTLGFLKQMAEKFHKDNNPQIVEGETTRGIIDYAQPFVANQPIPTLDRKAVERLEILIDDAKTEEELFALHEKAMIYQLNELYYTKLQSLQK